MNTISSTEGEFPRLTTLPREERIKQRQKNLLISGVELDRIQRLHQHKDTAALKEFLPVLWSKYQTHFPSELAQACRTDYPDRPDQTDQQILEQNSPANWDWSDVKKCTESKLTTLQFLHKNLTASQS